VINWEAVAAVSTAFTGLVILVTAVAAIRELRDAAENTRLTRAQLEHLRSATQFEGALAVFAELDSPAQVEARRFVQFDLPKRLADPDFRREVEMIGAADETKHPELTVLRCFERIGSYVSKGFVEPEITYLVASGRTSTMWLLLEDVVAIHRSVGGNPWVNFENLYRATHKWMTDQGMRAADLEARIRASRSRPDA